MQHPDEGIIHAWLDQALAPDEAARVAVHVAECASCTAAVAEARGLIAAASRILTTLDDAPAGVVPTPAGEVPGGTLAALRARRAREHSATRRRRWGTPRAVAAASVAFLAIASGTVLWRSEYALWKSGPTAEGRRVTAADTAAERPSGIAVDTAAPASNLPEPRSAKQEAARTAAPPSLPRSPAPSPAPQPSAANKALADRAEEKALLKVDSRFTIPDSQPRVATFRDTGAARETVDVARLGARAGEQRADAITPKAAARQGAQQGAQRLQQSVEPTAPQRQRYAPPTEDSILGRVVPTMAGTTDALGREPAVVRAVAGCYRLTPLVGVLLPYALPSELSLDTAAVTINGDSSWHRAIAVGDAREAFGWRPRTSTVIDLMPRSDADASPPPVALEVHLTTEVRAEAALPAERRPVATLVRVSCEPTRR